MYMVLYINVGWNYICLQLDSALTMDAMSVVFHGLSKMVANNSDVFRMIFRRGHVFNGENRGIPCTSPPIPWTIGKDIMNSLKNVRALIALDRYNIHIIYPYHINKIDIISISY